MESRAFVGFKSWKLNFDIGSWQPYSLMTEAFLSDWMGGRVDVQTCVQNAQNDTRGTGASLNSSAVVYGAADLRRNTHHPMKRIIAIVLCCIWAPMMRCQTQFTEAQRQEMLAMATELHHETLAYRAAVMQKMVEEANFFAYRLKLPTPHPIRVTQYLIPVDCVPVVQRNSRPQYSFSNQCIWHQYL